MPTTRSATSGKPPKSYVTKTTRKVPSHAHHVASAERYEQGKHLLSDPKFKGINSVSKIRTHTAARSGLSAVRMLKRGGTRRSKSRGRKYTMRW